MVTTAAAETQLGTAPEDEVCPPLRQSRPNSIPHRPDRPNPDAVGGAAQGQGRRRQAISPLRAYHCRTPLPDQMPRLRGRCPRDCGTEFSSNWILHLLPFLPFWWARALSYCFLSLGWASTWDREHLIHEVAASLRMSELMPHAKRHAEPGRPRKGLLRRFAYDLMLDRQFLLPSRIRHLIPTSRTVTYLRATFWLCLTGKSGIVISDLGE